MSGPAQSDSDVAMKGVEQIVVQVEGAVDPWLAMEAAFIRFMEETRKQYMTAPSHSEVVANFEVGENGTVGLSAKFWGKYLMQKRFRIVAAKEKK